MNAVRILYVNHTATVSGGERSLLDLLDGLPASHTPAVACPPDGELPRALTARGVELVPLPTVELTLRIGPTNTPRGVVALARAAGVVARWAWRHRPDLIHANSIRAGLLATPAPAPLIVHVRDCLPPTLPAALVRGLLSRRSALLLGNSRYTIEGFAVGRRARARARWVHSPVDTRRFAPDRVDRAAARGLLGLPADVPVIGVIGQLTPWKAQDDALRIARLVRARHPDLRLLVVGESRFTSAATRYDNRQFEDRLRSLADDLDLGGAVQFLGNRDDVAEVLRALDVLLVPSWEEPFGRVVAEGMAMGAAVVATSVGGPAEVITDGVDGRLVPPRQPELWAEVVGDLLAEPATRARMGAAARRRAEHGLGVASHVAAVLDAYRAVAPGVG